MAVLGKNTRSEVELAVKATVLVNLMRATFVPGETVEIIAPLPAPGGALAANFIKPAVAPLMLAGACEAGNSEDPGIMVTIPAE